MNYECPNCGTKNENALTDGLIVYAGNPVTHTLVCNSCGSESKIKVALTNSSENYRDEAWLREMYSVKENSMASIAETCGVSPMTIFQWLKRFEITTRRRGQR